MTILENHNHNKTATRLVQCNLELLDKIEQEYWMLVGQRPRDPDGGYYPFLGVAGNNLLTLRSYHQDMANDGRYQRTAMNLAYECQYIIQHQWMSLFDLVGQNLHDPDDISLFLKQYGLTLRSIQNNLNNIVQSCHKNLARGKYKKRGG